MHVNKHYAVLDLGSYNFHLLIAQFDGKTLQAVHESKCVTELASGLTSEQSLCSSSINNALQSIAEFTPYLANIPNQQTCIFGTGTLRQASNSSEFILPAQQLLNSEITIISGEKEAELIFLSTCYDANLSKPALIIDIGGGSTEFIVGQHNPLFLSSVAIGGLTYALRYFPQGKVIRAQYQQALNDARQTLAPVCAQLKTQYWHQSIGASGIIRSIDAVIGQHCLKKGITLENVECLASQLIEKGDCQHIQCPEDSSIRPDILPGGLVILHAILLELGVEQLEITQRSIREGAIVNLYQNQKIL